MKELKEIIEQKIRNTGYTYELISKELGMSRTGLYQSLENNSLKLEKFNTLSKILRIEPNDFFNWELKNEQIELNEPLSLYGKFNKKKKIDTKNESELNEVDFLRNRVVELIGIISELSKKIDK
jgi:transcriptional regulator with XRE-family HTH domain